MIELGGLLLDFDGVMVDSEPENAALLREFLRERFEVELTEEDERAVYGYPWMETFGAIFERHGIRADSRTLWPEFLAMKLQRLKARPLKPATGLAELLALPLPKAIVSGSERAEILAMMRSARINAAAFKAIVAASDVAMPKPAPEGYLKACELLRLRPAEAVAFEDSRPGAAAARRAGVLVAYVREFSAEDHGSLADAVFNTLKEAVPWARERVSGKAAGGVPGADSKREKEKG